MKRNLVKTATALTLALVLAFGGLTASAGSIFDAIGNAKDFVVDSLKTAGNAIKDSCVYIFTDDDLDTAFISTKVTAIETACDFDKAVKNVKHIKQDAQDIVEGAQELKDGFVGFVAGTTDEDILSILNGEGVVTEGAKQAVDKMAEGYNKMDNDLVLEALSLMPGAGTVAASMKVAKACAENALGIGDETDIAKSLVELAVGGVLGAAADGATELISDGVTRFVVGKAANLAVKTIKDAAAEAIVQ